MDQATPELHIICERDVGLFSLVQQVVATVPWALTERRVPIAYFGERTCYWTPNGYGGRDTVWEYYFEPLVDSHPVSAIPLGVRAALAERPPSPWDVGHRVDERTFASSNYGDHPDLRGRALPIPYQWDDPDADLRRQAKKVIDEFVRPRARLRREADRFAGAHLAGRPAIGVHVRGTDATSSSEPRAFRQGSLVPSRYVAAIDGLLARQPEAAVLVATDDQASLDHLARRFGERVVAYDAVRHDGGEAAGRDRRERPRGARGKEVAHRDRAARNGADAVVEYLLLSRCDHLVHNGSSLARTVLLNAPDMAHTNTHGRRAPR
jgi:hypothetical protein